MQKQKFFTVKRLTFIAIFAALAVVFYSFIPKIKLPIFPPFLEINFSMIPILICAFMMGPIDATVCVVIRFLVKLPMSSTGFVGELADVLIALPVVIAVGLIYHHTTLKRKTLLSLVSVVVIWVLMGVITNAFINIPFYSEFYAGGMEMIVGACGDAFKVISGGVIQDVSVDNFMFYYLLCAVIPFNLLLSLIVVVITLPIHHRLKVLYDRL